MAKHIFHFLCVVLGWEDWYQADRLLPCWNQNSELPDALIFQDKLKRWISICSLSMYMLLEILKNFKTLCGPNKTHLQCRWDLRVASSEPLAWKKDVAYRRLRKGKRERHILKSCPLQRLDIHPSFWPTSIVIISGSSHDFWDNRPPPLAPCSSYATPVTGLIFLKYSSFVPPTSASAQKLEMTFLTAY